MPIDQMGRFIPQTTMAANQATMPSAPQRPLSMVNQQAMTQASPATQYSQVFRPQASTSFMPHNYSAAFNPGFAQPQAPNPNPPPPPAPAPAPTPPPPPPPAQQAVQAQNVSGPGGYQAYQRVNLGQPTPQPQTQAPPPMMGSPSATQMAGRGNAQSVQNYLTALNQSGASSNNASMNPYGQMGQQSQSGFQGFGQNGSYGPSYVQQGYTGQVGGGMNYQNNMANTNQNYNVGNYAHQGYYGQGAAPVLDQSGGVSTVNGPGLANGSQNAPQWQTPKPWTNPTINAPGSPGSGWGGGTSQDWENYFYAQPGQLPPGYKAEQGAFYDNTTQTDQSGNVTSDERAKTNISNAESELQEFLDALGAYSYEYKDKADGAGKYISPMAQEFEKSKLGAQAVVQDEAGKKMVNYGRLAGVQTAALALLNHKYNALEKKFDEAISTSIKNRKK